jgi:CheY-like chemotaxis protein
MKVFDGLTVLGVEDDWFVRPDMVLGLQQEGWIVLEADTGVGAVKLLRETNTIDLLVTDIRLADDMTGWDVAEAVRASRPKVPVIYASGHPDNRQINRLKTLKRAMYGRASPELLRARMLPLRSPIEHGK